MGYPSSQPCCMRLPCCILPSSHPSSTVATWLHRPLTTHIASQAAPHSRTMPAGYVTASRMGGRALG
ncbi:hypothetical protein BS50DRAFT_578117 [Corynespora cassiicola Philippines]|uniref:Uncharacterized protein n=1 Tax=Corynespora cassiicola Philippines TaxID=1448308 RepID=A0A2T2NA81_CORCC|nr:hypothetical protein BS50DRAFT_578117 [Corynespora cassiicola Philippines]